MNLSELSHETPVHRALSVFLTNGDTYAWGDTITGIVTLSTESNSARFQRITVGIVEQRANYFVPFAESQNPYSPLTTPNIAAMNNPFLAVPAEIHLGETMIAEQIATLPHSAAQEWSFNLVLPIGIPLSAACHVVAHAQAVEETDKDQYASIPFVLAPPLFMQAIQRAFAAFADFSLIQLSETSQGGLPGYQFVLDYAAPPALRDRLDGVTLLLNELDSEITGVAEINPQEHTTWDHLRALLHADRVSIPVTWQRAELEAAGRARVASDAVTQRLHELLDPFLYPVAQ